MPQIDHFSTRRPILVLLACLALLAPVASAAGESPVRAEPRDPLVSTYSIVARDATTGELGVAVQSHWFQVGSSVPWAEPGVGAVATQSFIEVSYGPRGLERMRRGLRAPAALEQLVEADPESSVRQVAMVDAEGRVAAFTGEDCIEAAGHRTGDGYSVQANLMESDTVWDAMAKAYESARDAGLPLAERLLAALDAAEAEGGDIRGRQSAALLVVSGQRTTTPWEEKRVDLRVDDHPRPLEELHRLYERHRAYELMNRGDEAMATGELERAVELYSRAADLAPDMEELPFWKAVTLFASGEEEEALGVFRGVFASEEGERWVRLVPRLPASGLLPDDPAAIDAILAVAPPQLRPAPAEAEAAEGVNP